MTGTFDDWARSVKLEKKGNHFEKLVELPLASEKMYYKVSSSSHWTAQTVVNTIFLLLKKDITLHAYMRPNLKFCRLFGSVYSFHTFSPASAMRGLHR